MDNAQLKIKLLEEKIQYLEQINAKLESKINTLNLNGEERYVHRVSSYDKYFIALNEYQCANIVWLCNVVGYPDGNAVEPFGYANTGDWLGELHNLVKPGCGKQLPNKTIDNLKDDIKNWEKDAARSL